MAECIEYQLKHHDVWDEFQIQKFTPLCVHPRVRQLGRSRAFSYSLITIWAVRAFLRLPGVLFPLAVSEWEITWQIYTLIGLELLLMALVGLAMCTQVDTALMKLLARELEFILSSCLAALILGTTAYITWGSFNPAVQADQPLVLAASLCVASLCDLVVFMWLLSFDASPERTRNPFMQVTGLVVAISVAMVYWAVWGGLQGIGIQVTDAELSADTATVEQIRFQALIQFVIFVGKQAMSVAFTKGLPIIRSANKLLAITREHKIAALKLKASRSAAEEEFERSIAISRTLTTHAIRTRKLSKASIHKHGSFTATRSRRGSNPSAPVSPRHRSRASVREVTSDDDREVSQSLRPSQTQTQGAVSPSCRHSEREVSRSHHRPSGGGGGGEREVSRTRSYRRGEREVSRSYRLGVRSVPQTPRRGRMQKVGGGTAPTSPAAALVRSSVSTVGTAPAPAAAGLVRSSVSTVTLGSEIESGRLPKLRAFQFPSMSRDRRKDSDDVICKMTPIDDIDGFELGEILGESESPGGPGSSIFDSRNVTHTSRFDFSTVTGTRPEIPHQGSLSNVDSNTATTAQTPEIRRQGSLSSDLESNTVTNTQPEIVRRDSMSRESASHNSVTSDDDAKYV